MLFEQILRFATRAILHQYIHNVVQNLVFDFAGIPAFSSVLRGPLLVNREPLARRPTA